MAQTKKKRRRKHRGNQAGIVEARGRTGRSRPATEAKQIRQDRRTQRLETPPTWRSSINRAVIAAIIFGVLAVLLLDMPVGSAAAVVPLVALMYIPASYYMDRFMYNRHQRRKAAGGR
jgi:ABC-type xylose transport system permease subunit